MFASDDWRNQDVSRDPIPPGSEGWVSWFISGGTDARWEGAELDQLKTVPGSAFEVVATGPIRRPGF